MSDLPILYSFRRCPYAMRARMGLVTSGTVCRLREIRLKDKPAEMLAASPKGTVPVLVLADDHVIDQSLDIMRWALERNDPEEWLIKDHETNELIAENDGSFKRNLDRYKYATRYDDADPLDHRGQAMVFLERLNERLNASANLCSDKRSLADIAIFPFVRQFAEADRQWFDAQPLTPLQHWLDGHIASSLFARIMQKWTPWIAGDQEPLLGSEH